MKLKSFFTLLVFLLFANTLSAQIERDTVTIWEVETKDGNIYRGKILSKTKDRIFIKTEHLGTLGLSKKNIRNRTIYKKGNLINGKLLIDNYLACRYMLTPTAFTQAAGEGYFENRYVFINHFNFGVTDRFSIGGGFMPIFLIDAGVLPVWVIPKVSIPIKDTKIHLSAGMFASFLLIDEYNDETTAFIPFVMGSYGDENLNFSAGLGYGRFEKEWMSSPAFTFSGGMRIARRSFMYLEVIAVNTFNRPRFESQYNLFSIGARTQFRKIALDYGVFFPRDDYDVEYEMIRVIPYLGLFIPFGQK